MQSVRGMYTLKKVGTGLRMTCPMGEEKTPG